MPIKQRRRSLLTTLLLRFRSGRVLYCPECSVDSRKFSNVETLRRHFTKFHSNSVILKDPSSVSIEVVKEGEQRETVKPGVFQVTDERDKPDPDVLTPLSDPTLLATHRAFLAKITGSQRDATICPECWMRMSKVKALQKHLYRRHPDSDWLKMSICEGDLGICKIEDVKNKLSRHPHLLPNSSPNKKGERSAKQKTLPPRGILLLIRKLLSKYMDKKSGIYSCPVCGITMCYSTAFSRHLTEQHVHSNFVQSLIKNTRKTLLRKDKISPGLLKNGGERLNKEPLTIRKTAKPQKERAKSLDSCGNEKPILTNIDSTRHPETDSFSWIGLREILKNPVRVEIPPRSPAPELNSRHPGFMGSSESNCALSLSQEVGLIKVLCPLAKCGKSYLSILNVNWHLRYEHKSFLQLNETPAVEMMDKTTLQDESKSPSKKKQKFGKCFSSDSNSSPSGIVEETTQDIETNLPSGTSKKGKRKGRGLFPCPKCGSVFTIEWNMKYHLKNNSCFKKIGRPRQVKNPKVVNCEVPAENNQGLMNSEQMKYRSNIQGYVNYLSRHLKVSHSRIILFRVDEVADSSNLNLQKINDKLGPDLSENVQAEDLRQQETDVQMQIDRQEETFALPSTPNKPDIQELQKQGDEEEGIVEKISEESESGITEEDIPCFTESAAEPELAKVLTSENKESVGRLSLPKKKLPYLTLPYREGSFLEEDSISKRKQTTAKSSDKVLPSFKYFCPTCGKMCSTFSKFKKHSSSHQKRSKEKRLRKEAVTCPICEKLLAPEMNLRLHIEWHRRKGEMRVELNEGNYEETKEVMTNEEDELLNV